MVDQQRKYRTPPITESTIELRFGDVPLDSVTRGAEKLRTHYPIFNPEKELGAELDAIGRSAKYSERQIGYRLTTLDQSEVVLAREALLAVIQLAPYPGWDHFVARARRDWRVWKRAIKPSKPTRLGIRFMNRLDIPVDEQELMSPLDYVTILPNTPTFGTDHVDFYSMRVAIPYPADGCMVVINTTLVPSPVPGRTGLLLDLDLSTVDIPARETDLWNLVSRMRGYKNLIFEACITDRARELFDQ